jgi:peptide/nickel transport system permease protein
MTTAERLGDVAWHLVLPVATYTTGALATLSRYARTGVIDVIRADYIRTARAKGLSEPVVILKHALRNGMIPILTLLGSLLPTLVAGSTVIEVIFNIPGMGQHLYNAINLRDYNAVMAVLLASSVLSLLGILLSDLSYALVDPRISLD